MENDSEPTMRLSRALLVMLLLHIVAVGGFIASSRIREHDLKRTSGDPSAAVEADDSFSSARSADASRAKTDSNPPPRPGVHVVRQGESLMRIAYEHGVTVAALVAANGGETAAAPLRPGQELKLPDKSPDPSTQLADGTANALSLIEGKTAPPIKADGLSATAPVKPAKLPPDSGNTYVIGKGESVYTIAQKLKVSADSILKLNQIDDPKKLRPGQKLHIPAVAKTKGK